jgi:hypothetical protein
MLINGSIVATLAGVTRPAVEFMRGVRELVRVADEENCGTVLP